MNSEPIILDNDKIIELYKKMFLIRCVEDRISELISNNEIICPCHLYSGQEAIASGVCSALRRDDWVFSTHRSHGHYIAKGGDLKKFFAEIFCKIDGCSKGKGGSMHLNELDIGFPGSSAIVSGSFSLAIGAALSFVQKGKNSITVAFFGDGASNEGVFYESMNIAALFKLPVLFICENNQYSTHMPISECLANTNISEKAIAMGIPAKRIDGNNVIEVFYESQKAIENLRKGHGPYFIECMTYRHRGHVGPNYDIEKGLRSKEELIYWLKKDPITNLEKYLLNDLSFSNNELNKIKESIYLEIEKSITFGRESKYPDKEETINGVFREKNL